MNGCCNDHLGTHLYFCPQPQSLLGARAGRWDGRLEPGRCWTACWRCTTKVALTCRTPTRFAIRRSSTAAHTVKIATMPTNSRHCALPFKPFGSWKSLHTPIRTKSRTAIWSPPFAISCPPVTVAMPRSGTFFKAPLPRAAAIRFWCSGSNPPFPETKFGIYCRRRFHQKADRCRSIRFHPTGAGMSKSKPTTTT